MATVGIQMDWDGLELEKQQEEENLLVQIKEAMTKGE